MNRYSAVLAHYLRCNLKEPNINVGAEVGAWRGGTTVVLLKAFPRMKLLHVVDPWETGHPQNTTAVRTTLDVIIRAREMYFEAIHFARPRVHTHCMTSLEGCAEIKDRLDFVFIDGDHRYEAVKQDLPAWWAKLRPGGILIGHDYRVDPLGDIGVIQATDEFVKDKGLSLKMLSKNMYALHKE